MTKKRVFRVVITIIILLSLLAAGAAFLFMPKKTADSPNFSQMPTDTAGYNMIGNLPENLEAGGFMAGQNGLIYFTNFADDCKLYMCRENGEDMTKITDFPVCNINVMGSSVVFTGFDEFSPYKKGLAEDTNPASLSEKERFFSSITSAYAHNDTSLGGKLYAIYGLNSNVKPRFCVIDPDNDYFSPYLDRDGLYTVRQDGTQSVLANKFNGAGMIITRENEAVKKMISYGDKIYVELFNESDKTIRIMRIDAKTLFPLDSINGSNLYRVGNSLVFHGEDGFVYEIMPSSGDIKPISSVAADYMSVNPFGEIDMLTLVDMESRYISYRTILSKEQWYGDFAQTLLSKRNLNPLTLQNGWYNYRNANPRHNALLYFKANDNYYISNPQWSADWLNQKLDTAPLVSLDDVISEDLFTPAWIDFSEDAEPINPSDAGDFGSERPSRPAGDSRGNASATAPAALDAAIMLLAEDESIADKYTGESVEKLRELYGSSLETTLTDAASVFSTNLSRRFGIELSPQEAHDILISWLQSTDYEIGDALTSIDGTEALAFFTVKNPVELTKLYAIAEEGEFENMPYTEALLEADRYSVKNFSPVPLYMKLTQDAWIIESPEMLLQIFIWNLD